MARKSRRPTGKLAAIGGGIVGVVGSGIYALRRRRRGNGANHDAPKSSEPVSAGKPG